MYKLLPLSTSLLLLAGPAFAAEFYWDGETDGDWTDASNWDTQADLLGGNPANAPTSADDVNLVGGATTTTIDLGGAVEVTNFDILAGADSYTIGTTGDTLTVSNNFISRNNVQTVDANIVLSSTNKAISNRDNNDALTINGSISTTSNGNLQFGSGGSTGFDDGVVIVNGGINTGTGNISIGGKDEQLVRFNTGSYTYNYLNVRQGTIQVVDGSLEPSGGRYVLGREEDGTLEYVGTGDLTLSQRFDVGSLTGGDAATTGGAVFKASQTSGVLTISGLHGTNDNPTADRSLTLDGTNTEANTMASNLSDVSDLVTGGKLSLVKKGTGNWQLTGNNDFTGTTTVEAGQLTLDDTTALYGGTTASYTEANITVKSGATLLFDFDGDWNPFNGTGTEFFDVYQQLDDAGAGGFEAGSNIGVNVAAASSKLLNQTIADTGDGALGFVKTGDGILRMNQNQTYTGDTLIQGGSLELEGGSGGGTLAGDVVVSSGASLDFDKTSDYTFAGEISGAGSVSTLAAVVDTISLTADNTFTGGLNINGGTVEIGAGGTTGDIESDVAVASGATFSINRDGSSAAFDFDQNITGDGSVNIVGIADSVVSLSGTNDYTGGTIVNGGGTGDATLLVSANGVLGSGDVTMTGSRAVLEVGAAGLDITNKIVIADDGTTKDILMNDQSGSSTLSGGIELQDTGHDTLFTVKGGSGNTLVVSGDITGTGDAGIRKNFGGNLVLTGTNTYAGATAVTGGILLINGDSSGATGAITVENVSGTATLGGTGVIGGDVTVGINGTLAPGASVESLSVGAVSFEDGSAFSYEIDSGAALSVGADLLIVNGNLGFDGVVTLSISDLSAGTIVQGTTFSLINYTGTWDGDLFTFDAALLADGETFAAVGYDWVIDYNATVGGANFAGEYVSGSFVNITAVPEPSTFALLAGALVLASVITRRRR